MDKWTLVQHSGFGYANNPEFQQAVETRSLSNAREIKRVNDAGGMVFDSYSDASDREFEENYPPEVQGLVPKCRGLFSEKKIDELRVYIPVKEE